MFVLIVLDWKLRPANQKKGFKNILKKIFPGSRGGCRACRLQRCLDAGMDPMRTFRRIMGNPGSVLVSFVRGFKVFVNIDKY